MRHSQIIFLCFFLLVLAVGGVDDITSYDAVDNTGVMGLRGEVSMLKGGNNLEAGPYFGVGIGEDGPGLILGYDYRKYTGQGSGSPKKLGAQFEVNISEWGPVFHLRPSLTSTTKRGKPIYGGVHGLLAMGNLMEYGYMYVEEIEIDYRFFSLGAGLTAGAEFLTFDNNSIQLQVDVSMVKNAFNIDDSEEYWDLSIESRDDE